MDPRLSVSKANALTLDNLISQMRELRFREKPRALGFEPPEV